MSFSQQSASSKEGKAGRGRLRRWREALSAWWAMRVRGGSTDLLADYRLLAGLVGGSAVVALLSIPDAPRLLALLGVAIGLLYYMVASRRERYRRQLRTRVFPAAWREILSRRVPLYSQLDDSERRRFEDEIQIFLGEQRIYALGGVPGGAPASFEDQQSGAGRFFITDEHRLLIAASAATLLLGRPEWRLPTVRDIIVYPTAFTEESYAMEPYSHTVGMVHAQGPILFALDALERSYPRQVSASAPGSPYAYQPAAEALPHVGLHEFAHVLDFIGQGSQGVGAHGVPGLVSPAQAETWARQIYIERERLLAGESVLHPYGLKSEAELFAVAVESFFQEPLRVRAAHPELYTLLSEFFNQDPAARLFTVPGLEPALLTAGAPNRLAVAFRPWFSLSAPVRYTA